MHRPAVPLGLTAWLLLGVAPPCRAQIPGEELITRPSLRQAYLAAALQEIRGALAFWVEAHEKQDPKAVAKLLTDDVYYSPIEGWTARGKDEAQDSLAGRIPQLTGYHVTLQDFTANGGLAYVYGQVSYRLEAPGRPPRDVHGSLILVFHQQGRWWRVRAYFERPG